MLRLLSPTRRVVVVYGFPSIEGNAVEIVRELTACYPGKVVWLDAPPADYLRRVGISSGANLICLPKISLRAVLQWACAEAVFFTHGLFGTPRVVARKPTVNLWHGEGMKYNANIFPDRRVTGRPVDYVVGMTTLYSRLNARACGLPDDRILCTGLPRNDALFRGCSDSVLSSLGIDPGVPFVVWMPTFRRTSGGPVTGQWSDVSDASADDSLARDFESVAGPLAERGVQLVVKPHPTDLADRMLTGAAVITEERLADAGVLLYEVLGRSAGLVTDVSSVATDYLVLDRPIAYFMPDIDDYVRTRGVWPRDALEHLAGRILGTLQDVHDFADEVVGRGSSSAQMRADARNWLGLTVEKRAAKQLLEQIASLRRPAIARSLAGG